MNVSIGFGCRISPRRNEEMERRRMKERKKEIIKTFEMNMPKMPEQIDETQVFFLYQFMSPQKG